MKNKPFQWSWSKLNAFETCAFRHLKCDLQKEFREEEDPDGPLAYGNKVHDAFKTALKSGTPLPQEFAPYEHWRNRVARGNGELLVEKQYGLARDFTPTEYHGPLCWCRIRIDVARIDGPVGIAIDWKTGKRKEPTLQLMLAAQALFSGHSLLEIVQSKFIWLNSDAEDIEVFTRQSVARIWATNLLPRVAKMEEAAQMMVYPPKPGGLCRKYCPVKVCQFYQRGAPR